MRHHPHSSSQAAKAAKARAGKENPNLVLLSDDSDDSDDDTMQTEVWKHRRQSQASREAAVDQFMDSCQQERNQEFALNREKELLQQEYDEFIRFVEEKHGVNCDGHQKVFCGYMRLSSEDKDKAKYKDLVCFVFITIRINTVDGDTLPSSNFSLKT